MKNNILIAIVATVFILGSCTQNTLEETPKEKIVKVARPYNALNYKELVSVLEDYDTTRKPVLEKALGYEDTRMNYFSIETIENYLAYVKNLSQEKGIKFTGINFVSASYPKGMHGHKNYQTIIFMPTTEINGKNICFDPVQSTKNKMVTVKEMLGSYGYHWVYDSKEDYDNRTKPNKQLEKNYLNRSQRLDVESGAGNYAHYSPPYY